MTIKVTLMLFFLFVILFSQPVDNLLNQLEMHFMIKLDTNATIIYHSKNEVFKQLLENTKDSLKAFYKMQSIWPSKQEKYIDSIYTKTIASKNKKNGFFIHFFGDSTYYVSGFYAFGKRDSHWIYKRIDGISVENYSNCIANGEWYKQYPDGKYGYKQKFINGNPIDTSFSWYENGQIQEMEIFKDGKSTYHKCFTAKGEETFCSPD